MFYSSKMGCVRRKILLCVCGMSLSKIVVPNIACSCDSGFHSFTRSRVTTLTASHMQALPSCVGSTGRLLLFSQLLWKYKSFGGLSLPNLGCMQRTQTISNHVLVHT